MFYVQAYIQYLQSDASEQDADAANCFFGLIEFRHSEVRSDRQCAAAVKETLTHLAGKQAWYDAEIHIYGNFAKRAEKVLALIE